jgi:hypothetical protein
MNYGGSYRNTPARMIEQARAEDLDVAFNLIVNKEQRIPDIEYFSSEPDPASDDEVLLLHAQEYHTSYWGHLGLLGLDSHLLIPDYSAYPGTAACTPTTSLLRDWLMNKMPQLVMCIRLTHRCQTPRITRH